MGTGVVGAPMAERIWPGVRALGTGRPQDGDSKGKETGRGVRRLLGGLGSGAGKAGRPQAQAG